jgi:hypothetical protein
MNFIFKFVFRALVIAIRARHNFNVFGCSSFHKRIFRPRNSNLLVYEQLLASSSKAGALPSFYQLHLKQEQR